MIFLRSVVGKLWITILLLVSFVLLILTVLLLEFFENFHVQEIENDLLNTADRIVQILEDHEDPDYTLEISSQLLGQSTKIMIVKGNEKFFYPSSSIEKIDLILDELKKDKELYQVFHNGKTIMKEMNLQVTVDDLDSKVIIVGIPLEEHDLREGFVFVFQSLDAMNDTIRSTTDLILLSAGVAIVLTTIFAFFLSTRITAPLRKMREVAFEVARGNFDTKVPTPSTDEIGELATAFNQMGRQLKFNMNALSQEKENLSNILGSMADGVITINIDGSILPANPPAERFLQNWFNRNHREEIAEVPVELMELFQLSVEQEKAQVGEIQIGEHYWAVIVSPLYNNEKIRGAVAVLRDMTENRKLEKMKDDFIANVSHELRTPISMLQGYSEAIVDDIAGTQEEKKEMAQVIYDESLRMGRLVNELLDLARMESGHLSLKYERVSVEQYLLRIVSKFQVLAKEKDIHLSTQFANGHSEWILDPDRIEQVLTNLIDNSIRHTSAGGHVTVVQYINHNDQLVIQVQDNGIGISKEDLPFIFDRFYKADKARTRGQAGTGLGLAIAHNIVKAHKGEMSVVSSLGEGTTFTIEIPKMLKNE